MHVLQSRSAARQLIISNVVMFACCKKRKRACQRGLEVAHLHHRHAPHGVQVLLLHLRHVALLAEGVQGGLQLPRRYLVRIGVGLVLAKLL